MTDQTLKEAANELQARIKRKRLTERAKQKVSRVVSNLVLTVDTRSVFFTSLLFKLRRVYTWDVDTMAVDGLRLFINPEFVADLTQGQVLAVLVHEVLHIVFDHLVRKGTRVMMLWNIATDLVINQVVRSAGYELPKCALYPGEGPFKDLPPGKNSDQYYEMLFKRRKELEKQYGDCKDPGGCGEVKEIPDGVTTSGKQGTGGKQTVSAEEVIQRVKANVKQAAMTAAKIAGNLPAEIQRLVDHITNPPLDWRSILRVYLSTHARNDYSWVRPSRRFLHRGIYLPGMFSEELGEVIVSIDTSGSITDETLNRFANELEAILCAYQCSATFVYHDCRVNKVETWKSEDGPLKLNPVGRGGTDHRPVFNWIEQHAAEQFSCLICLTDLYTCFPASAPHYPVLWVVTDNDNPEAPFGQVVKMGD